MESSSFLENFFQALPLLYSYHAPGTSVYRLLKLVAREKVEDLFSVGESPGSEFGPFGKLIFPYHQMGVIDSLNLFDLDELIMFSFYWVNRDRYHNVLDIGANLGLHSLVMSKCGFDVRAYEPDPQHFDILLRNLKLNGCNNDEAFSAAVSSEAGEMEFIRVLGNTTSSHLAGSKANPYGELERLPVRVEAIGDLLLWADLVKMDAEGHEKEIFLATSREHWLGTDALVEIENEGNAIALYEHFKVLDVNLFTQLTNWQIVRSVDDMPTSYRDGTLFVTCRDEMPW